MEAIKFYDNAIRIDNGQNKARKLMADLCFQNKDYQDAIPLYKQIRVYEKVKECFKQLK